MPDRTIDQQIKQEILTALKKLSDQNTSLRIEAIEQLGKIGVSHPQIIERLQSILANDPSLEARLAAQNAIDILQDTSVRSQNMPSQIPTSDFSPKTESNILAMLQKQNAILDNIRTLLLYSLEKENDKAYHLRSRVTDVDLSIGSMIALSFKWLIASIPVGIVLFFVLLVLRGCNPY